MRMFKKGDRVKVWSLQSFFHGGFLDGADGIVSQDQTGRSVLVTVSRIIHGEERIDPSYEVYPQQLELVEKREEMDKTLVERFDELISYAKNSSPYAKRDSLARAGLLPERCSYDPRGRKD